jgi:hypothetical protein
MAPFLPLTNGHGRRDSSGGQFDVDTPPAHDGLTLARELTADEQRAHLEKHRPAAPAGNGDEPSLPPPPAAAGDGGAAEPRWAVALWEHVYGHTINSIALSHGARRLAIGGNGNDVLVFDLDAGGTLAFERPCRRDASCFRAFVRRGRRDASRFLSFGCGRCICVRGVCAVCRARPVGDLSRPMFPAV